MASTNNKSTMINIPRIQVFRPTLEEMKDFEGYINKIEKLGAHKAGLAKIIPPPEWKPRRKDSDYQSEKIDSLVIKAPIQQIVQGRLGLYQQYNIQKKSMSVREFKKLAENPKYRTPEFFDYVDLERKYWKNVTYNPPIYGADVPGSLYDDDVDEFNINRLNTILDLVNESYGIKIMGVNTAYLYFGMWKTTFAWHTEDMDLYSINYLHFGAPKSWYCVPPEHGRRLERLAAGFFPTSVTSCPAFLRHKMTLISPAVLKQYSIPFNKITQEAGEFMVTFPYSYHAGYNHGYNCAESTNFATERWVEYGKRATRCNCRSDSVKISMEAFVKKYQPDKYDLWLHGKDIGPHPEDPTHISPAPLPSDYELQVLSKVSKSKRHPPYKPEAEISDAESLDNNHCEQMPIMTAFPTKAALKQYETPGPSSSDLHQLMNKHGFGEEAINSIAVNQEYLRTSPPDMKEAVKRIRNRFDQPKSAQTKRSRKSSNASATISSPQESSPLNGLNYNSQPSTYPQTSAPPIDSSLKNMCSQSSGSWIPLTWVSKGGHDPGALQLIDKFLGADFTPSIMRPSTSTHYPQPYQEQYNPPTSSPNYYEQSPSIAPSTYYHHPNHPNHPNHHNDHDHHPSEQHTSTHPLTQPINYHHNQSDERAQSPTNHEPTTYLHQSNVHLETVTTDYFHQPHQPHQPHHQHATTESKTSTEDLRVNDIIMRTKKVHSDDLSKLLADEALQSDLRELLKRLPVQPYLYQHLPYNFFGEQLFNSCMSSIYPHCSICLVMRKFEISDNWVDAQTQIPTSSPILIPMAAYGRGDAVEISLEEIIESPLLVCSDCKVCVHSICYGIVDKLETDEDRSNWRCDRCINSNHGVHCCLCPLRGGALKKTQDDSKWAHVICALVQPGVNFKNGPRKTPIDISGIKKNRANSIFKCVYCQKINAKLSDYINGYCIQCYMAPRCSSKFHTTCAHLNGVKFEMDDWPDPIRAYCTRCIGRTSGKHLAIATEDEVDLGTIVLAKHKNRRYYEATVIDKTSIILHHAHLEDNSVLQILKTSDIVDPDIEKNGNPEIGDPIKIVWEKIYQTGKYAGNHLSTTYVLKFEDGSVVKSTRELFYRLDEEIPAKVQAKRSKATDVRTDNLFWATTLKKVKPCKLADGIILKKQPNGSTINGGNESAKIKPTMH